eukprot:GFUD01016749.1.p1 GENE.GFUD01016749.1~~GFUD01016749.1.p1  ORF type:complete len:349 (+),score=93.66 GFUD01016749.1:124-1170(+)
MSTAKREETPDGWVEVPTEPSVPEGWKKKVYRMNGRQNPKWVQYYDLEGNRYNSLQSVETYKQNFLSPGSEASNKSNETTSRNSDFNPRLVKSVKKIHLVSSCDICNIELNSVEELQVHIKEKHSADDDDESGKYFSDDDNGPVEDTSPDDPNLKCVECNTQYKKPNQFENHMKKRHGGIIKEEIVATNKVKEKEPGAWEQFDEDMVDYEEEEELEDEFLENIASKTMEKYQGEIADEIQAKPNIANPPEKPDNKWYASVQQIVQRFRLQDYQVPSKISSMSKYRDEAMFVEYVTPLLRSVNMRAKTSTLFIMAKAKWFELMQGHGVTPVNGSLTNLRKPRKILLNTV